MDKYTALLSTELSKSSWRAGLWTWDQKSASVLRMPNCERDMEELLEKLRAKGIRRIVACYEAGRDGHWVGRWFEARGVEVYEIAPHTIERPRARRPKTDRLDALTLVRKLRDYLEGDKGVWKVVWIPPLEKESRRELSRERDELLEEVNRHRNRLKSKLAQYGIRVPEGLRLSNAAEWKHLAGRLRKMKTINGDEVPEKLIRMMKREAIRMGLAQKQLKEVEEELKEEAEAEPKDSPVWRLQWYRGIGLRSSQQLDMELMDWDRFKRGKQFGQFIGLAPGIRASGSYSRDLGISKQGSGRLRHTMIELAWLWVKWQPQSELVKKWKPRLDQKGRVRRMAIVALARQLAVKLWLYITRGVVIEGAIMVED